VICSSTGYVYVGGERRFVAAPVRTWRDGDVPGFPKLPHRRRTSAVVLHWTGGEGDAEQMHRVLVRRKLSVHFHIDHMGVITQFCDTEARCAHAGTANAYSIGIEIQNRANKVREVREQKGITRELVTEQIHGVDVTHTTFTAEQTRSALALTDALCIAYSLPFRVPMQGGDVLATTLIEAELSVWSGVLGHLHLSRAKVDPGLALLRAIAARPLRSDLDQP